MGNTWKKVCVGALHPRSDADKEVAQFWSTLSLNMQFLVDNSSPTISCVKCVQHGCLLGCTHSTVNELITRRCLKSRNMYVSFINFPTSTATSHVPSL